MMKSDDGPTHTLANGDSESQLRCRFNAVRLNHNSNDFQAHYDKISEMGNLTQSPTRTGKETNISRGVIESATINNDTQLDQKPAKQSPLTLCWATLMNLFSINAAPGRKTGFYRIHPKTARKIRDEIVRDEMHVEREKFQEDINSARKSMATAEQNHSIPDNNFEEYTGPVTFKSDVELGGTISEYRNITIEKVFIILCILVMFIGYPCAIYIALNKLE
ncbi:uncharacterized protein LOC143468322 [Clavelina lepadiformis]|uniref:uncharacterized protein LOC143468322 n=1 Tax=Clavelina lepadiformis TaxID=159417 RepID=UPI004042DA11